MVLFLSTFVSLLSIGYSIHSCLDLLDKPIEDPSALVDLSCTHQCNEPSSCNNYIIDCYPHTTCGINCTGTDSCQNLTIMSDDHANLECIGTNSCNKIQFIHREITENTHFLLPKMQINYNHSIIQPLTDQNTVIGTNYILARGITTDDILRDINLTHSVCYDDDHAEHRDFGYDEQIAGHTVLFCDDCVLESVYEYYKNVAQAMLDKKRKQLISDNNLAYSTKNMDDIDNQFDDLYYPWDNVMVFANQLETRVIEYILYEGNGPVKNDTGHGTTTSVVDDKSDKSDENEMGNNIGWHVDDGGTLITQIIILADPSEWSGGVLEYRMVDDDHPDGFTDLESLNVQKGDVIIHESGMTEHHVLPITGGNRKVFVMEWWNIGRNKRIGRWDADDHFSQEEEDRNKNRFACCEQLENEHCYCTNPDNADLKKWRNEQFISYGNCECVSDITTLKFVYLGNEDISEITFFNHFINQDQTPFCSYNKPIEMGQEIICSITNNDKIDVFPSKTGFEIIHKNGSKCKGYFDTSCKQNEIGNVGMRCDELILSGYTHKNGECDDGLSPCTCDIDGNPVFVEQNIECQA